MPGKLESDQVLRGHIDAALAGSASWKGAQDWVTPLANFFAGVKAGIPSKLDDADFLESLWDKNPVSATGNGTVKVGDALADQGFRRWFAEQVVRPLPLGEVEVGCCRFRGHLVKVESETGGGVWERDGSSAGSSSLRL